MGLFAFVLVLFGLPYAAIALLLFANGNWILAIITLVIGVGKDHVDTKKLAEKAPERIREKIKYVERKVFVGNQLTQADAFSVLGISIDGKTKIDRETVQSAYKKMMLRVHPDQGGSLYLATKVNEAKQLLLGK